eukprot:TRINITY_DN26550_c0_g2_i1.p1 TRINITY_DN26550_c0_g2~~TRINITY_DN26550_c0_g2_i1.p1  ORF type:complete len:624 (+),score=93.87 TRINITY_DN26550_c0_g2_i1:92-1963(+)
MAACKPTKAAKVSSLPHRHPSADHWNGVNLGGWLLLEPGPAHTLFDAHVPSSDKPDLRCEWDMMEYLRSTYGRTKTSELIKQHRETHITKADFTKIRSFGMNVVRLPMGYWIILGTFGREPYEGHGLEYVDRAVAWAEESGLQIVLDLHGCPGGESPEAPCGRRRRPYGRWNWRQWRFEESLQALDVLARRYRGRKCVTGMAVCNEPSPEVPSSNLCRYYHQAVNTIRAAGMSARRVAVVLPVFQRPEEPFIEEFQQMTGNRHRNICFDIHAYHCFENEFNGKSFAQQLRHVEENAEWFRKYPVVVGEWSLALGCATWATCGGMTDNEVYQQFGCRQVEAYKSASHGSFFWNWTEREDSIDWNFQQAYRLGLLSTDKPLPGLPPREGVGEDLLEEICHPSPANRWFRAGNPLFLRVFHGRYVDVEVCNVGARWTDKGPWQELTMCTPADTSLFKSSHAEKSKIIQHGQVVRLRNREGRFLVVGPEPDFRVFATKRASLAADARAEFVIHIHDENVMRHRSTISLMNRATETFLDADEEDEGVFCRWNDPGGWQQFVVEKPEQQQRSRSKRATAKANALFVSLAQRIKPMRKRQVARHVSPLASSSRRPKRRRVGGVAAAATAL